MHTWILVVVLCVGACGSEEVAEGEHDARFSGAWIVDQPFHAGYEATVYEFEASGLINVLDACDFSSSTEGYVTGSVENLSGTRCEFGGTWRSNGPNQLLISGDCADDRERMIALAFDANSSLNAAGTSVEVASVDGEPGWAHRDFAWQWTRCPAEGCEPVWVCR